MIASADDFICYCVFGSAPITLIRLLSQACHFFFIIICGKAGHADQKPSKVFSCREILCKTKHCILQQQLQIFLSIYEQPAEHRQRQRMMTDDSLKVKIKSGWHFKYASIQLSLPLQNTTKQAATVATSN